MSKRRIPIWVLLIGLAPGVLIAAIAGLWVYMSATARPLHPELKDVPSVADSVPSPKWAGAVEQARQIARAGLSDQNLPGLSIAVGVGGEIVWAEGFGYADIDTRTKVDPDTRFRIGTASVALTSAAVGLLLEQGRLKLDDEIQTYVPEYPKKPWPVTLRQLMAHTAGVTTDGGDEGPFDEQCLRPVDALKIFGRDPLRFEPGTRFRYSSYGWMLVSAAIEAAAGESFVPFMRKRIFEPLGMDRMKVDSAVEPNPDRATFYFPRFAADPRYGVDLNRVMDFSCYAGASAFLATPSDLVRFGMAINRGKLLPPPTVQLLQTSQRLPSGEETGYGLGWDLETVTLAGEQTTVVGHDAEAMGGMIGSFMIFPKQGLVLAVTSNIGYADTFAVGVKIGEAFAARITRDFPNK
ncbi:MAG TPA: serine hydrolase domain-containing protein [Vicinamibacterales bacterium]|nr:serine hydrolase domain-containing protein [Vicinamibacterales bacterium]